MHPEQWVILTPQGIYCPAADAYIDPLRPVARALITHGHADHARPGHGEVIATPETLAIMRCRYGDAMCNHATPLAYGVPHQLGDVTLSLHPAGHILGSAQLHLSYAGSSIVFAGDYKRAPDPTCAPFQPVACDVFVTEATFALPVFRHNAIESELEKLLTSLRRFPARCHLLGAYALGKCQRIIAQLRQMGYDAPIYLHGAMLNLCQLYREHGIALGELLPATAENAAHMGGALVICPPSALHDRWAHKFPDPVIALASGWMRVRARARQKGVELPLVISDHADWDELLSTLSECNAREIWITHGREDALIYAASQRGLTARALRVIGYEEESE